jgi:hypothetical protein
VHAARPDHDQQPVVDPFQHVLDVLAPLHHYPLALVAERQVAQQGFRRDQLDHALDPLVANPVPRLLSHSDDHLAVAFLHFRDSTFHAGIAMRARASRSARTLEPAPGQTLYVGGAKPPGRTPS